MALDIAASGVSRGRPSRNEVARVELVARAQEAGALVGALRFVARSIEALAFDAAGDTRQAEHAARLHGIADQVERRWENAL